LQESEVLTSVPTDIFNAFSTFVTLLDDAKCDTRRCPRGSAPDLFDKYRRPDVIAGKRHTRSSLSDFTKSSKHARAGAQQTAARFKNPLKKNLKLFVIEQNPKTAFTVY